jgi:orotate phosphoribosyltransferase
MRSSRGAFMTGPTWRASSSCGRAPLAEYFDKYLFESDQSCSEGSRRGKAPKDYGTRRLAEGGQVTGRRLVVIEDVVTSGGQIIESCAALREDGADIVGVLCVIDREAGGADNLASHGLELRSLFTMSQLRGADEFRPDARSHSPTLTTPEAP